MYESGIKSCEDIQNILVNELGLDERIIRGSAGINNMPSSELDLLNQQSDDRSNFPNLDEHGYRVLKKIGEGSQGTVYLVEREQVKSVLKEFSFSSQDTTGAKNEVKLKNHFNFFDKQLNSLNVQKYSKTILSLLLLLMISLKLVLNSIFQWFELNQTQINFNQNF